MRDYIDINSVEITVDKSNIDMTFYVKSKYEYSIRDLYNITNEIKTKINAKYSILVKTTNKTKDIDYLVLIDSKVICKA